MRSFKSILCVVKAKEDNNLVYQQAFELAKNHQADVKFVEVFDVITQNTKLLERVLGTDNIVETRKARHKNIIEAAIQPFKGDINTTIEIRAGIPYLQVIYDVLQNNHDLVIKLADNGGLIDRLFGSEDMHLLRKCPSPVMLLAPDASTYNKNILVAVDVNDNYPQAELATRQALNVEIINVASSLAVAEFSELNLLSASAPLSPDLIKSELFKNKQGMLDVYLKEVEKLCCSDLDKVATSALDSLDNDTTACLKLKQHVISGRPREVIPKFANENHADLLVLGTVARTGIPGIVMGNTAENILNRVKCSVLAIKPPGFVTPIKLDT